MPHRSLDYEILRQQPPVVAGLVNASADARLLVQRLQAAHPGTTFVAVVTTDEAEHLGEIIEQLRPVVGEIVFTKGPSPSKSSGADLADRALNELGVSQDFVFTVPHLSDAIDYAITRLLSEADQWSGTGVVVAGSSSVVKAARRQVRGRARGAQGSL